MQDFKKIVRPGTVDCGDGSPCNLFVKIEHSAGQLSISGVEGPKSNGDARGSCGQIVMGYAHRNAADNDKRYSKSKTIASFADGWDVEKWLDLVDIWDEWHLNDMRANCEHQTGPDWAPQDVTLYHYRIVPYVESVIRDAKKRAEKCIRTGKTFTPTADEVRYINMPDRITTGDSNAPAGYVPNGPQYSGDTYNRASELKKSNWVKPNEHPLGILCKPCPVCGYKYGTAWKREEVPVDVLNWLQALPDADKTPAWV